MNNLKKYLRIFFAMIIIIFTVAFFVKEFRENIISVQSFKLRFDFYQLALATCLIIMTKFFQTYEWYCCVNSISISNKIKFFDAFTITNSSSLTKYLPGKIWEYALQMQWLGNRGFSKSLILYVNLFVIVVDYLIVIIISCLLWLIFNPFGNFFIMLSLLLILLLGNGVLLFFKNKMFKKLIEFLSKILKKKIGYYEISIRLILSIQCIHILFLLSYSTAIYFICRGVGLELSVETTLLVLPALLLAGLISMLIIVVPGGLGVQEGSMYLMLITLIPKSYALIIPITIRIVQMVAELCVGIFSIVLLKKSFENLKYQNNI